MSSILSGNRNFEGRIHPEIRMNFLASPMLVVAYSLVGKINVDINTTSLGKDSNGNDVYLKDIWPSNDEINEVMSKTIDGEMFNQSYKNLFEGDSNWMSIPTSDSDRFDWDEESTYIQPSPFLVKKKTIKKNYLQLKMLIHLLFWEIVSLQIIFHPQDLLRIQLQPVNI